MWGGVLLGFYRGIIGLYSDNGNLVVLAVNSWGFRISGNIEALSEFTTSGKIPPPRRKDDFRSRLEFHGTSAMSHEL